MNILVFSWRGPKHPNAGGAEQVMHEHMKGWVKSGHKVFLFTSFFDSAKKEEDVNGIKVIRRSFQYIGVQTAAFFWYLFGKHLKFDLVVDQFHGIPFFTPLYVREKKLAVIQEVAREVWFQNHFPIPINWIVGGIGYLSEPFIFLFYKKVKFMTGSQSAREDVLKMGVPKKNIVIVPHGVIIDKPKNIPPKEKKKTIVFLGVLTKDKGIEDAIKYFSLLNRKGDYQFWIIGKGDKKYVKKLVDLCKKLKISSKTEFLGFVSSRKKFELLARAHVLVNPSIREGWGLVNIEANAMGIPTVAYHSPGLVDSVRDGQSGIICRRNTPANMANEVANLLRNKNRYKNLRRGAILWSKKFSWKDSREKSLKLITIVAR